MQPNINDIRNQLRQKKAEQPSSRHQRQSYTVTDLSNTYSDPPGVIRETSTFQKLSDYRPPEKVGYVLGNFPVIIAGMMFCLAMVFYLAPEGMRLPGSGDTPLGGPGVALFASSVAAVFTYMFVKKFKDGAENLHKIRTIKDNSMAFKIGAAIGAGLFCYTYFYSSLEQQMIDPPSFEEKIKGLFSLELLKLAALAILGGKLMQYVSNKWFGEDA